MLFLDFEKPIADLYQQLEELQKIQKRGKVNVSNAIFELLEKINTTKKKLYQQNTPWQKVQLSRHPLRPYTLDYIALIVDNFVELHGDRYFGDDKAIIGGLGNINDVSVIIIGHQKGRTTKERQFRNFGMANPEGYRKAQRLMQIAEKFNLPVVTLIDTPGAYPGLEAEERGQAEAIAKNLFLMAQLRIPILSIIIGEGASGGAIGIGMGDVVLMMENTWYSVISPESCSSILWRNWDNKEKAAEQLRLTADDMLSNKLIDGIIIEPIGGAHNDIHKMAETLKDRIQTELLILQSINIEILVEKRQEKYCNIGKYTND